MPDTPLLDPTPLGQLVQTYDSRTIICWRAMATMLDWLLLYGGLIGTRLLFSWTGSLVDVVFWLILATAYFPVLEGYFGVTVGKKAVGLCVADEYGKPPGLLKGVMRYVVKQVELSLFFGLPTALYMVQSGRNRRFGDLVSDTYVLFSRDVERFIEPIFRKHEPATYPVRLTEEDRALTDEQLLTALYRQASGLRPDDVPGFQQRGRLVIRRVFGPGHYFGRQFAAIGATPPVEDLEAERDDAAIFRTIRTTYQQLIGEMQQDLRTLQQQPEPDRLRLDALIEQVEALSTFDALTAGDFLAQCRWVIAKVAGPDCRFLPDFDAFVLSLGTRSDNTERAFTEAADALLDVLYDVRRDIMAQYDGQRSTLEVLHALQQTATVFPNRLRQRPRQAFLERSRRALRRAFADPAPHLQALNALNLKTKPRSAVPFFLDLRQVYLGATSRPTAASAASQRPQAVFPRQEDHREFVRLISEGTLRQVERHLYEKKPWLDNGGATLGTALQAVLAREDDPLSMLRFLVEKGLRVHQATIPEAWVGPVRETLLAVGPRWRLDAFDENIREIYVVRQKAWGLSFVPGDVQLPIRYGGDYDGAFPVSAASALAELDRELASERLRTITSHARWIIPFIVKMTQGEDFPLADVLALVPDTRSVIRARTTA